MNKNRTIGLCAGVALASFGGVLGGPSKAGAQPVTVTPATMPRVATIDERYPSYNVEMAEVIGGGYVSTRASKYSQCARTSGGIGQAASRMASTVTVRRRKSSLRRAAGRCWLRRERGRRKLRSSSWPRQNRAADRGHLKPRMGRYRPFKPRWPCSIVQSQMTKPDRLAGLGGRHHVADLDLAIGDDHPIDQQLDQGPPLLE
jgi:hypothetical protein